MSKEDVLELLDPEYRTEENRQKLESCQILSTVMGFDEGSIGFTSSLGSDNPAYTSMNKEEIYFSTNYFNDQRDDSFIKFQRALLHEATHLKDIKNWKKESVIPDERFVKLFRFFSEGLASQFEDKKNSYTAESRFFKELYDEVVERKSQDDGYEFGKVLLEKSEEKTILKTDFRTEKGDESKYQVFEDNDEIYSKAESRLKENYSGNIQIDQLETEEIEFLDKEAELMEKHYYKTYRETEKKIKSYLEEVEKKTGRRINIC